MNARATHFPLFDSLRAIAFACVLVTHAAFYSNLIVIASLGRVYVHLDVGVEIFFVISAFLLYRPFVAAYIEGEPPPLARAFGWRRFVRVAPPYWLALTLIGIWIGAPKVFRLANVPFYYGFSQIYNQSAWSVEGLPQAWSLCVEVAFYVFLPIYALALRRLPLRTRAARIRAQLLGAAGLVVIGLAYNLAIGPPNNPRAITPHFALPAYIDYFAIGMALATLSVAYQGRRLPAPLRLVDRFPILPWLVALLALVAVSEWIGLNALTTRYTPTQNMLRHCLYAVIALGVVLPAAFGDPRRGVVRRILANRALLYVGMVSYMAYLLEFAVMTQLERWHFRSFTDRTTPYLWFVVAFVVTIALASASWYLYERPILKLKRLVPARRVERGEATLEPATPAAAVGSGSR